MLKTLEKYWLRISIFLMLIVMAALLFWPGVSRPLGLVVLFFSLTMTVAFLVRTRVDAYRKDPSEPAALMRNIAIDLLGMLVALAVVSLAGKAVVGVVGDMAGMAAEQTWPGSGIATAILAGLLAGLVVGAALGFVIKLAWGRLTKSNRA